MIYQPNPFFAIDHITKCIQLPNTSSPVLMKTPQYIANLSWMPNILKLGICQRVYMYGANNRRAPIVVTKSKVLLSTSLPMDINKTASNKKTISAAANDKPRLCKKYFILLKLDIITISSIFRGKLFFVNEEGVCGYHVLVCSL